MKALANIILVVAVLSLVLGIISRLTMTPIPMAPGGIEASVLLGFTKTCLLLAIALMLSQIVKTK